MYRLDDEFIYKLLTTILTNTNNLYIGELEHENIKYRLDKIEEKLDFIINVISNGDENSSENKNDNNENNNTEDPGPNGSLWEPNGSFWEEMDY